jgi:nucleotide-binding universal stress UspA family protein
VFPTKILLATDGSQDAAHAAQMAITLSEKLDSNLHVVHVGIVPSAYAPAESEILDRESYERMRELAGRQAHEALDEEVGKIREAGGEVAGTHAPIGRPDAEIAHLAKEIGAGLVVVGSRGWGPLKRAVMGSVSDSVVRHARCPVLVVRPER